MPFLCLPSSTQMGYTPIHVACHYGNAKMANFLIQNHARINGKTKVGRQTLCAVPRVGPFLYFDELCVSRMATLLYIRQLSRDTPTLSTCCSNTVPQPTSSPWSVHPCQNETLIPWCLLLLMPSFRCVTGQNGNTALSIACRLGYISVVDTLRAVTDESLAAMVRHWQYFISVTILIDYKLINKA